MLAYDNIAVKASLPGEKLDVDDVDLDDNSGFSADDETAATKKEYKDESLLSNLTMDSDTTLSRSHSM